jgi:hypothetical protein
MSGRWIARIVGLIMLLVFFILMANLQRRLIEMERGRPMRTTTTSTTGTR